MLAKFKKFGRIMTWLVAAAALVIIFPRIVTWLYALPRLYSETDVPSTRVAIVFGAGLRWDGTPSPVLRDRITTAAELYFSGKVDKLLMSGDNRFIDYNEPGSMYLYAISLGVPGEDIVLDYAGRRTYDTCYRAQAIFGVTNAVLVTQQFHLPRALFTCNMLGVKAVGVEANNYNYGRRSLAWWQLREVPATMSAFWELFIQKPLPVLGDPEPIS